MLVRTERQKKLESTLLYPYSPPRASVIQWLIGDTSSDYKVDEICPFCKGRCVDLQSFVKHLRDCKTDDEIGVERLRRGNIRKKILCRASTKLVNSLQENVENRVHRGTADTARSSDGTAESVSDEDPFERSIAHGQKTGESA